MGSAGMHIMDYVSRSCYHVDGIGEEFSLLECFERRRLAWVVVCSELFRRDVVTRFESRIKGWP